MKPFYRSRIFWVNTITLVIGMLGVIAGSEFVAENPKITLFLTTVAVPILNVILRWLTDQPITSITPKFDQMRSKIKKNMDKGKYSNLPK